VTLFAFGLPTQSSTSTPSTTWLAHTATDWTRRSVHH
jgi:hypothetical protein